jgi:hypothetical protein
MLASAGVLEARREVTVAADARGPEAEALIEKILKLAVSGDHDQREMEPVFQPDPPKKRRLWRRDKRPVPAVRTGWRIGCYYRSALETLQGGYRVKREFSHPVYLLSDGRLVVGAFRAVDEEGTVTELEPRPSRRSLWFTPLEDGRAFFAASPGHYFGELRALHDDLT